MGQYELFTLAVAIDIVMIIGREAASRTLDRPGRWPARPAW